MIRFAAMVAALPRDKSALAAYEAVSTSDDLAACRGLLSGVRPKRVAAMATIVDWAAHVAGVPDWLVAASMEASGDRAETAALLLPPHSGPAPSLSDVVRALTIATPVTAHATMLDLWSRLPPEANHVLNRLASGTFRTTGPKTQSDIPILTQSVSAVMVLVQPSGPEISLALWNGDIPVPIARVALNLPETAQIMAWVRANTLEKFGPVRQVIPTLVFEVEFDGVIPNRRRKSGVELRNPRVVRWLHNAGPEQADRIDRLTSGTASG